MYTTAICRNGRILTCMGIQHSGEKSCPKKLVKMIHKLDTLLSKVW
jgi:hypothetical protein